MKKPIYQCPMKGLCNWGWFHSSFALGPCRSLWTGEQWASLLNNTIYFNMASKRKILGLLPGSWTASELSVRYKAAVKTDIIIHNSTSAYEFISMVWDLERITHQEQYMAFFLNGKGKTIGYRVICTGGMSSTPVDIRLIVSLALHSLATNVILAHNHPSGSLEPSAADISTTKQIRDALRLIEVKLWDHQIIGENGCFSMADAGLL
jgi:DNA repair protein RadC